MDKILSISIAAYNVKDYIRENLDSIIASGCIDELELFVIDDGGTDETLEIAREYEKIYPDSIHVIHKEDEGYGSTVNFSIPHASGKYFRLLDGDDYVNSDNLRELIIRMRSSDADAFFSDVTQACESGKRKNVYSFAKEYDGRTLTIEESEKFPTSYIWAYAFKTEIVKAKHKGLLENAFYVDCLYLADSLSGVETIEYFGKPVYCYRLGIQGQSVNKIGVRKHYLEGVKVDRILLDKYEYIRNTRQDKYILKRIAEIHSNTIRMICMLDHNMANLKFIKDLEREVKINYPEVFHANASKRLFLLRKTGYLAYWINYPS